MLQYAKYEDSAEQVYRILLRQTSTVQMLSCDEAFMDVTGLGDPQEIATTIRAQAKLLQMPSLAWFPIVGSALKAIVDGNI